MLHARRQGQAVKATFCLDIAERLVHNFFKCENLNSILLLYLLQSHASESCSNMSNSALFQQLSYTEYSCSPPNQKILLWKQHQLWKQHDPPANTCINSDQLEIHVQIPTTQHSLNNHHKHNLLTCSAAGVMWSFTCPSHSSCPWIVQAWCPFFLFESLLAPVKDHN
jgi:hypothetical protein